TCAGQPSQRSRKILGISARSVVLLRQRGLLPGVAVGDKYVRTRRRDLESFVDYPSLCIVGSMPTTPMPVPLPSPMPGATMRRLLGWTQVELAVALGVTSNSVARWERGEVSIRPPIARLLRHVVAAQKGAR